MKRFFLTTMLALLAACGGTARGAETNTASRLDLASFEVIWERNIFNANRSPRSTRVRKPDAEKGVRIEFFALTGTMSYEKGRFAFFEGTSSEYQKVLQTAESIAGYKIASITPHYVKLNRTNGPAIELPVGMQMKRQDDEEWRLEERTDSPAASSASPESSESPSTTTSASAGAGNNTESSSGGGASDVLKKLLEKREQEMKNAKP